MRLKLILALVLVLAGPGPLVALETAPAAPARSLRADFHVAPAGKDTHPGTAQEPFATVAKAREAVRAKIAAGLDHDILVLIRGGTYEQAEALVFGPEDSGTEKYSITYAACPGEEAVISGGRKIGGWKRGEGEVWRTEVSEVKAGTWYPRQLFVAGRRAVRARTPNLGEWWKLRPGPKNSQANDATVTLGVDHPIRDWKNASDVEVVWINNNDGTRKRLGSVNAADNTFTLPPPHAWPHGFSGEYNISYPSAAYSCYFENALELLDQPGEWYLDRQTGVLSYWPREGQDLERAEVVAPVVQKTLLAVAGTPQRPVRNLHFRGVHVAHVDWPLPPYGFAAMFGCLMLLEQKEPARSWKFSWIDPAVSFRHARGCSFTGGAIEHAGGIGLSLLNGCAENVIEGNRICDLGGGGITAGGLRNRDTWKWADPLDREEHKGYRIANNHIHDCGLDYCGAVGIFVGLTQEAVVSHNLIHDISYAGIVLGGNETPGPPFARNNTVEYNHIHDVMKVAVDGAGIYVSFPQAGWGAAIRGNLIHDLRRNPANPRGAGGWSAAGIYLDGVRAELGCRGYRFEKNVVYRTENPLFFCQCSEQGNVWRENVFAGKELPAKDVLEAAQAKAGPRLSAWIKADPGKGEPPLEIRFDGSGSFAPDAAIVGHAWDFGDGLTADGPVVSHVYKTPGAYTARLTVKDDKGATDTASAGITVTVPDALPPALASATANGSATRVVVTFSKEVNKADAETVANYAVDNGVAVRSVALADDGVTVTLTTAVLSEGLTYTLSVKDIKDRAARPNTVPPNTQKTFIHTAVLARWKLDEGKGEVAADSSGNGHHGTLGGMHGGPAWTKSARGMVLSFDGVGDRVETNTYFPDLTMPFSISLWVNPAATQVQHADILGNHGEPFRGLSIQQDGNNVNSYGFGYGDGKQWQGCGNALLSAGVWQHVAVVCDGTSAIFCVDGVEKCRGAANTPLNPNPAQNFTLGLGHHTARYFHGCLSDVRIYTRALSGAETEKLAKEAGGAAARPAAK